MFILNADAHADANADADAEMPRCRCRDFQMALRNVILPEIYEKSTTFEQCLKILYFQKLWTICRLWTNSVLLPEAAVCR